MVREVFVCEDWVLLLCFSLYSLSILQVAFLCVVTFSLVASILLLYWIFGFGYSWKQRVYRGDDGRSVMFVIVEGSGCNIKCGCSLVLLFGHIDLC